MKNILKNMLLFEAAERWKMQEVEEAINELITKNNILLPASIPEKILDAKSTPLDECREKMAKVRSPSESERQILALYYNNRERERADSAVSSNELTPLISFISIQGL